MQMETVLSLGRENGNLMHLADSGLRYRDCWGYCACWGHCRRIAAVSKCSGSESCISEQCESRERIVYLMILQLKCLHSKKNCEFCKGGRLVRIPAGFCLTHSALIWWYRLYHWGSIAKQGNFSNEHAWFSKKMWHKYIVKNNFLDEQTTVMRFRTLQPIGLPTYPL